MLALPDDVVGAGDHVTLGVPGGNDVKPYPVQLFILHSQHQVYLLTVHCTQIHIYEHCNNQPQVFEFASFQCVCVYVFFYDLLSCLCPLALISKSSGWMMLYQD